MYFGIFNFPTIDYSSGGQNVYFNLDMTQKWITLEINGEFKEYISIKDKIQWENGTALINLQFYFDYSKGMIWMVYDDAILGKKIQSDYLKQGYTFLE